ncbi:SAM-dependent methyltransferase [Desulfomicrobium macestii]|uniref:SAM-dependent methyltransferase n=1 Tax=Desulfomicrobium macestii TaxID=90731 RepID=A0ABR9H1K2_9BACT|nr:class I SAM-dependent methyltransferase [Desulfomicrobium macestii]MBE1424579.1 SAM-dependent methyltransferase [Desulfomicrobium macestii]
MTLVFDGERYVPEIGGFIHAEHMHRYRIAQILTTGKDVLDVACGEGYGSNLLAADALSVTGIDISAKALDNAQLTYSRDNLCFIQGNCAELPCKSSSFDVVASFETIEHHDQHEEMLHELRRVLRPDGVLLISSPNRPEYNRSLSEPNPYHVKELDFNEFAVLLQSHFQNVVFYAHRVLNASCIAPLDDCARFFRHFDISGGGAFDIPRPVYYLAVASNGPLPDLGASVYEVQTMDLLSQRNGVSEARLYISEIVDEELQAYSESRGAAVLYPVSGQRQVLRLPMPADLNPLACIRLDPANRPMAMWIHGLALEKVDGSELWRWNGDARTCVNIGGLSIRNEADGLLLLCLNDDPQFDLDLPGDVLARMPANACLVIDVTPQPLTDVIAEVLRKNDRLIADLRADLSKREPLKSLPLSAVPDTPTLHLANDIEMISSMLKNTLDRRDQTIARQAMQLKQMREQLLRAEAQLDLLKDVMLGGPDDQL